MPRQALDGGNLRSGGGRGYRYISKHESRQESQVHSEQTIACKLFLLSKQSGEAGSSQREGCGERTSIQVHHEQSVRPYRVV
jgi:hypothetical protein